MRVISLPPVCSERKCRSSTVRFIVQDSHGLHCDAQLVRMTPTGIAAAQPIWQQFEKLSAKLFEKELLKDFSQAQFETHLKVNEAIRAF